jgi:hypothetical protein
MGAIRPIVGRARNAISRVEMRMNRAPFPVRRS